MKVIIPESKSYWDLIQWKEILIQSNYQAVVYIKMQSILL